MLVGEEDGALAGGDILNLHVLDANADARGDLAELLGGLILTNGAKVGRRVGLLEQPLGHADRVLRRAAGNVLNGELLNKLVVTRVLIRINIRKKRERIKCVQAHVRILGEDGRVGLELVAVDGLVRERFSGKASVRVEEIRRDRRRDVEERVAHTHDRTAERHDGEEGSDVRQGRVEIRNRREPQQKHVILWCVISVALQCSAVRVIAHF